jgi:hypothetical protein
MSTKAEQAMELALAAGFEVTEEFDASNQGDRYFIDGSYKVIIMRRLHGARPIHGFDSLELRTCGPKLINAVLRFGDGRAFASKTCTSIPAFTRALLDVRNGPKRRRAVAAHLNIPITI